MTKRTEQHECSMVPDVSVIIPVYNVIAYVRRSVESAIGQTLRNIEVICADDGSTDGSGALLDEYAAKDPRIRVLHLKNGGVSAARNAGLDVARGRYVAFLDADDELEPGIYGKMVAKADARTSDLVQCGQCDVVDGKVTHTVVPPDECTGPDIRSCPEIVRFQSKYVWDKLYRRDLLEKHHVRFAPYGYHEDHLFIFEVDLVARNFASVPDVGYRYSKSSEGAATRAFDRRLLDCPKAYWDICRKAREEGLFGQLASAIWHNCSMSYSWRIWQFRRYDDRVLQAEIVKGWHDFFQANFPRWQQHMHLQGYPVVLPPHDNLKVLLLGGTGALGGHLREILADGGHDVFVTSRSGHEDRGKIRYLKGDAHHPGFFKRLMATHWDVIVDFMIYRPEEFQQRLDTLLEQSDQYVFLSSARVYANSNGKPLTEDMPRHLDVNNDQTYLATNEYALAKARSEDMLRSRPRKNWTIIRPYVTFSETRLQLGTLEKEHWLKRFVDGKPIVFSKDVAARTTTLTYGRDVALGMAAVLGKKDALGETFHITSPKSVTWQEVLDLYRRVIEETTGKKCAVVMTETSCQLRTTGRYQVAYDRLYDRRFDNAKIGKFIDVSMFRDPKKALEDCLKTFLKEPKFLPVNAELDRLHDEACEPPKAPVVRYTVERNVQILIAALKAHGVNQVIASPGTTNLTFVASVQHDSFFTVKSAPDERSAAYMACGLAAESGKPVVITCTGATASRNYLPGLTEAYYRKLPVLAVTGTVSEKRSGHLTPQFVDRSHAPVDTVRLDVKMPSVNVPLDEWENTVAANRAILELTRHGGGPVHINLETAHSTDYTVEKLPPVRVIRRYFADDALPELPKGRVAVFVGAHLPWTERLAKAVERFCDKYDAPVFCDHTSNCHLKDEMNFTLACYQQSGSFAAYRPQTLIHLGEVTGDYPSLKICGGAAVWRVSADGEIRDQFRRLVNVFEMDEPAFFERYAEGGSSSGDGYRQACARHAAELLGKVPVLPFSNIWIASQASRMVPAGTVVHFGILNSFRSWSLFPLDKSIDTSCNTGGFGIDGCLSTVLGASLANPRRLHFAVLGDLAFFYDLNSLGNRHVGANLRILLVNNGKGVEFRHFNHPAHQFGDAADEFVAAGGHYGRKSPDLVRHYAEDLGFRYLTASSKEEYEQVAKDFWSPAASDRPMVFEVFTDSADEAAALEKITLIEGPGPLPPLPPSAAKPPVAHKPVVPVPSTPARQIAIRPSRRIAILTFHTAFNCGAHLQAWALQTVLQRLGFEPEFPDCTNVGMFPRFDEIRIKAKLENVKSSFGRFWKRLSVVAGTLGVEDVKRHRYRMFAKRCLRIRPMKVEDVERRYDMILVGSDQVWNPGITRKETSYYRTTLFKSPHLRRYTYAVSVGDLPPKAESLPYFEQAARLFENLSLRENLLPPLTDRYGRRPTVDPDPTLLLSRKDFDRIACPNRLVRKPYLLVYTLTYREDLWLAARTVAKKLGLKPVIVQVYQYGRYGMRDGKGVDIAVSPDRFLAYFRDAEVVLTSSFHGTAFSLIYGKRFAVLPNFTGKIPLRSVHLLRTLHESHHLVDSAADTDAILAALSQGPKPATVEALRRLSASTVRKLRKLLPDVSALPRTPVKHRPSLLFWPFSKAWGGVKCLRDNGVGYTIKHTWGKVLRFAGIRSPL